MKFSNSEIAVDTLPNFAEIDFIHSREDYPLLWLRVTLCAYLLLILACAIPAFILIPDAIEAALYGPPRFISLAVLALATFQVWHGYRWAKIVSYGIREHDVVLRSGVFWRKETVQPLKRIQHVEVVQGPIEKRVGLCKVKLFSAGTVSSTFVIPGLDQELGNRLREFVLAYRSPFNAEDIDDVNAVTEPASKPVSEPQIEAADVASTEPPLKPMAEPPSDVGDRGAGKGLEPIQSSENIVAGSRNDW